MKQGTPPLLPFRPMTHRRHLTEDLWHAVRWAFQPQLRSSNSLMLLVAATCLVWVMAPVARLHAQGHESPRKFFTTRLALERVIGDEDGVLLERPTQIKRLRNGGFVVFDFGNMTLQRFTPEGRRLWKVGKKGQGPGEFANGADIRVTDDGSVVVLDDNNQRLTDVHVDGTIGTMTRLDHPARRLLGIDGGHTTALMPFGTDTLWHTLEQGRSFRMQLMPSDLHFPSSVVAESYTGEAGGRSVIAFRWSDLFLALDSSGAIQRRIRGVDSIPFPGVTRASLSPKGIKMPDGVKITSMRATRIDPRARPATGAVTVWRNTLLVLSDHREPDSTSVIDTYDITSGSYLGSLKLPVHPNSIAVLDDQHIAAIDAEMVPVIRIWRLTPVGPHPIRLEE